MSTSSKVASRTKNLNGVRRKLEAGGQSLPLDYTLSQHHHRFAEWAAARAIQRGLADVRISTISDALKISGISRVADTARKRPTTAELFDSAHRRWCRAVMGSFRAAGVGEVSYGRAAKLIAVYLKSRIVLGGHHGHAFARVIHPPIDRLLLQALSAEVRANDRVLATRLRTANWTSLTESGYWDLIDSLRGAGLDRPAFWHVERFWDPRRERR
jgi:hypothetical protein